MAAGNYTPESLTGSLIPSISEEEEGIEESGHTLTLPHLLLVPSPGEDTYTPVLSEFKPLILGPRWTEKAWS